MMRSIAGMTAAAMLAMTGAGIAQTATDAQANDAQAADTQATDTQAADTQAAAQAEAAPAAAPAEEQDSLTVYFDSGSTRVANEQETTLDQAARLFREGSPIVMIVAGGADTVGDPDENLERSVERADAVVDGLVARGIPAERLQLVGRGNTDLAVDTGVGVESRENRRVEITWR